MKNFLKRFPDLYLRLYLLKKIGLKLVVINFLFQRVLRRQSFFPFGVNFTSTIADRGMIYFHDAITLASFAISGHCYFQSINGIELGKNCLFAPGVKLISSNHQFNIPSQSVKCGPIKIGDDVWIGTNVIILPGVQIGNKCIIGAGSVVSKSFNEDGLVIVGNPATVLRKINAS